MESMVKKYARSWRAFECMEGGEPAVCTIISLDRGDAPPEEVSVSLDAEGVVLSILPFQDSLGSCSVAELEQLLDRVMAEPSVNSVVTGVPRIRFPFGWVCAAEASPNWEAQTKVPIIDRKFGYPFHEPSLKQPWSGGSTNLFQVQLITGLNQCGFVTGSNGPTWVDQAGQEFPSTEVAAWRRLRFSEVDSSNWLLSCYFAGE